MRGAFSVLPRESFSESSSLSSQAFQCEQVSDQVGHLRATELVLVGGHGRIREYGVLAEVPLVEREEMLLVVDKLNGIGVFVQPPASDDFAVSRDCAHGAVQGQHHGAGIAKRALQE